MGLFLIGLAPIVAAPFFAFYDWPVFWSAGAVTGTSAVVDGTSLLAWQQDHGLSLGYFPYLPGAALVLWPLAQLPLPLAFLSWAMAMLACALLAGRIAGRVFGLPRWLAVGSTIAWAPLTGSIVIGQNTALALLLATVAVGGLVADEASPSGLATGLLLYKPTLGLPFVGLLVLRGRWRALVVAAAVAAGWYVAGVLASGGDVGWPRVWFDTITGYVAEDAVHNADKAVSLPGLLARLSVGPLVPLAAGAVIVLMSMPRLLRDPIREAAAGACLVGVAASPHAFGYDAALMLPFIWWVLAGGIAEPWRTRLVVAAYVLAPLWLVSAQTQISAVAVLVLGGVLLWLSGRWRGDAAPGATPPDPVYSLSSSGSAPSPLAGTATPAGPSERGSLPLGQ